MKYFLGFLVTAILVSSVAQAHDSKHHNMAYHGQEHHAHPEGNWHGQAPHKHEGKWVHRGHQHAKVKRCPNVRWHNTKDLQKWRVKHKGKELCYSENQKIIYWAR